MNEIDTESPVIWPSWCYSENLTTDIFKQQTPSTLPSIINSSALSPASTSSTATSSSSSECAVTSTKEFHCVGPNKIGDSKSNCNKLLHKSSTASKRKINGNLATGGADRKIVASNNCKSNKTDAEKMLSERSLLLSGYNNNSSLESSKKLCELKNINISSSSHSHSHSISNNTNKININNKANAAAAAAAASSAAAAAAYLYLEKVKNEKLCSRGQQADSLKGAGMMESSVMAHNSSNNNTNNNSITSNNNSNNSGSNSSNIISNNNNNNNLVISHVQHAGGLGIAGNTNNNNLLLQRSSPQQQQQQQHMGSSSIKRERLSPGTNGDITTAAVNVSRSRSATPSSFRGLSPQQTIHNTVPDAMVTVHNLSTNLLNSIQQAASAAGRPNNTVASSSTSLAGDFSAARNYSNFMRSLAAKYNNSNPNDSSRRNAFFENSSLPPLNSKSTSLNKSPACSTTSSSLLSNTMANNKEISVTSLQLPPPTSLSPSEAAAAAAASLKAQSVQNQFNAAAAAAAAVAANNSSVSPFMTSLLSSLPFSQGVFPPLIDMSSTQALMTLARAAKEAEIQNILRSAVHHPKLSTSSTSSLPRPNLNAALQQAAQFVTPTLMYASQMQQQHQKHNSTQSSPKRSFATNSTTRHNSSTSSCLTVNDKLTTTATAPLDLSSQPPSTKRFKAESTQNSLDGLMEQRRSSYNSNINTPSPPLSDKAAAIVGSSTSLESTNSKVGSSCSPHKASAAAAAAVKSTDQCQAQSEEINSWSVDDVCAFVASIDICAEYVKHFREQCIDGSGLPLLTEEHLVSSLGLKLGPALKLRSMLAKKLGGPCPCVACVAKAQQLLALQAAAAAAATNSSFKTTTSSDTKMNEEETVVSATLIANGPLFLTDDEEPRTLLADSDELKIKAETFTENNNSCSKDNNHSSIFPNIATSMESTCSKESNNNSSSSNSNIGSADSAGS